MDYESNSYLEKLTSERYKIPYFQRGYVWHKDNWNRLWEDVRETADENEKYFMGILILKEDTTEGVTAPRRQLLLIDGQQRITTMILLLKALALQKKELKIGEETLLENFHSNYDKRSGIFLKHNRNDKEAFEQIVKAKSKEEIKEFTKKVKKENPKKEYKILDAYSHFSKEIAKLGDENILKTYQACSQDMVFVLFKLNENEDAQRIFETLNSLGVSLTAAELVKNHLFSEEGGEDDYKEKWENVFERKEKEYWDYKFVSRRANIDLFLYSALLVLSKGEPGYKNPGDLFKSYKHFIEKSENRPSKSDMADKLKELAAIYKKHIDPQYVTEVKPPNFSPALWRLNLIVFGIGATVVIPYLLYILTQVEEEEHEGMFESLECYIMRRQVCGILTQGFNRLFPVFIKKGKNSCSKLRDELARISGVHYCPEDEEFSNRFDSKRANARMKLILYLIELHNRDEREMERLISLGDCHLEHIMPWGWSETDWPLENNISKEERNENYINQIGNLTIVNQKLNSTMSNKAWVEKKRAELKEYSSGIRIIREYLDKDQWTEEEIKERTEDLLGEALRIWPDIKRAARREAA